METLPRSTRTNLKTTHSPLNIVFIVVVVVADDDPRILSTDFAGNVHAEQRTSLNLVPFRFPSRRIFRAKSRRVREIANIIYRAGSLSLTRFQTIDRFAIGNNCWQSTTKRAVAIRRRLAKKERRSVADLRFGASYELETS